MARHFVDGARLRLKVAQEAARIMSEHGVEDFRQAKSKAAERLNLRGKAALPTNQEVEAALRNHQSLFGREDHADHIASLRTTALNAMHVLDEFSPRLVGPVLAGTAAVSAAIHLHVFADNPDDVVFYLEGEGLNLTPFERRLKNRRDEVHPFPALAFTFTNAAFEITIFPYDGLRQAPISPVNGKPMQRASKKRLQTLLQSE